MVAVKSSVLLALFALAGNVFAMPPACLLGAVSTQENPADLNAVCGDNASQVQEAIAAGCGSDAEAAQAAFASTCEGAGVTVSSYTASATSTDSMNGTAVMTYTTESYDSSCSCTKTSVMTTTAAMATESGMTSTVRASGSIDASGAASAAGASGSASRTGPSAPESTGGAPGQGVGSLAAAVIAVAGVVAVL